MSRPTAVVIAVVLAVSSLAGCSRGPSYKELLEVYNLEVQRLHEAERLHEADLKKYSDAVSYQGQGLPQDDPVVQRLSKEMSASLDSVWEQKRRVQTAKEKLDSPR